MPETQTVNKNISLYRDLYTWVKKRAENHHRGNFSQAIQRIIEEKMESEASLDEHASEFDAAVDALSGGDSKTLEEAIRLVKQQKQSAPTAIKKTAKKQA